MISEWNRNRKSNCPCEGCTEPKRHIGCHATCPEYVPWAEERRRRSEEEFKRRQSGGTISHSAIRKMWIRSRWQNQQPVRRSGKER